MHLIYYQVVDNVSEGEWNKLHIPRVDSKKPAGELRGVGFGMPTKYQLMNIQRRDLSTRSLPIDRTWRISPYWSSL